ncbi:hypothetical protein [Alcanivorax sp. DG881]|uniref:hypothetical protein n=1 Tax=Alcanivorax sp. DG881 TaxID=236097 RepID=UPI00058652D4|nr:hypothetical protein [Alcanivorax sp. DG881]
MRDELQEELKKHFPKLIDEKTQIAIGDGWFDLITCLLQTLMITPDKPRLDDISTKFGRLRVTSFSGVSDAAHGAIAMSEMMSRYICSVCGNKTDINHTDHRSRCLAHSDQAR